MTGVTLPAGAVAVGPPPLFVVGASGIPGNGRALAPRTKSVSLAASAPELAYLPYIGEIGADRAETLADVLGDLLAPRHQRERHLPACRARLARLARLHRRKTIAIGWRVVSFVSGMVSLPLRVEPMRAPDGCVTPPRAGDGARIDPLDVCAIGPTCAVLAGSSL
jgi:hypothetical protein